MATGVFQSEWWSVSLPRGWAGRLDQECATFQAKGGLGALQISAAEKSAGSVTDEDLLDFAENDLAEASNLSPVVHGSFSGFCQRQAKGNVLWIKWWLRCGKLMIFATYNGPDDLSEGDLPMVNHILNTLATKGSE